MPTPEKESVKSSRLAEKVVVIVGGTAGLGLSAARACLDAGARLVCVGRNRETVAAAQAELGEQALVLVGDARDPAAAANAIAEAGRVFGGFHALYHVAGGSGRRAGDGPLHEISDAGWTETLNLNLTSLFYSNRAAVRQFLAQGTGGSVLNIGSVLGFSPSPRYFGTHAYAAAKSAVIGLTKSSAAYYAPQNIRFNLIVPALVDTPMAQRATQNREIIDFIATKQPLDGGRVGVPSDLDSAAIFFLSDESKFITGQALAVDGGWSVTEGQYGKEP